MQGEFSVQQERYKIDPLDRPMGPENVLVVRPKMAALTAIPDVEFS